MWVKTEIKPLWSKMSSVWRQEEIRRRSEQWKPVQLTFVLYIFVVLSSFEKLPHLDVKNQYDVATKKETAILSNDCSAHCHTFVTIRKKSRNRKQFLSVKTTKQVTILSYEIVVLGIVVIRKSQQRRLPSFAKCGIWTIPKCWRQNEIRRRWQKWKLVPRNLVLYIFVVYLCIYLQQYFTRWLCHRQWFSDRPWQEKVIKATKYVILGDLQIEIKVEMWQL